MLRPQGTGGRPPGGVGGLSGVRRWPEWLADVGDLLQRLLKVDRSLEVVEGIDRVMAELLELWQCSGSDRVERSWPERRNTRL